MFKNIYTFIDNESGQGTAEYLLILAAVIAIVVVFKDKVITALESLVGKVSDELNNNVKNLVVK